MTTKRQGPSLGGMSYEETHNKMAKLDEVEFDSLDKNCTCALACKEYKFFHDRFAILPPASIEHAYRQMVVLAQTVPLVRKLLLRLYKRYEL